MPINPNIALGIQPVQQPNLLGQMGQIMAIRAAQQEMEGSQEARNYFAKPASERGDPSRLLGTKQGQAAYKALNEGQVKQLEATQKRVNLIGAGAGAVLKNPTVENFRSVVENLVNNQVYSREDADKAIATIGNDPSKIPSFVTPLYRQAISAEKDLADQTSRANAATAAAAPMMNARLAREKYDDQLKYGGDLVTTTIPDPEDPKKRIEIQTRRPLRGDQLIPLEVQPMPMRAEISPSSATSAFQPLTGGGGGGSVNALNPQGGTAPAPNVNALNPNAPQGPTFAQPKPTIRQPVAIIGSDGKSVLVPPEQAVGKQPATAFAESTAEKKAQLNRDIATAIRNLELVVKPGGLLEKSTGSGLGRLYDASKGFFGGSTEGAIAGAQLAPIADMVLKMVPRFEGPQSNKDVDSYLAAAGKLADTGLPNDIRKGAAEVILKLMKERKGQFEIKGQEGGGGGASPSSTGDIATDPAIQSLLNKYK
jgi:hypothetical protein